jgi:hypothetical protein
MVAGVGAESVMYMYIVSAFGELVVGVPERMPVLVSSVSPGGVEASGKSAK